MKTQLRRYADDLVRSVPVRNDIGRHERARRLARQKASIMTTDKEIIKARFDPLELFR
jgi:hypothetical protein